MKFDTEQLPGSIPADFQVGITWKDDDGKVCKTVSDRPHKSGKRIARLVESDFVSIGSIAAMHYYARIQVASPGWKKGNTDTISGGYGGKNKPALHRLSLDAERVLTRLEKDMNGQRLGKIGDTTHRFNSSQEARAAGIALFKKTFGPGWVLLPETLENGEDDYPILAET